MSVEPVVATERPASDSRSFPWPASFVILGAIWGCSFWWIKLGLRAVSPVDVAFARLAAGAVALLVVAALTRTRLPRRTATWGHLFVLALFLNSAPFTLFAYGETHISAVLAGIINALTPLATMLAALTIFRQQRPNPKIIAGLGVGFTGVLVVVGIWHGLGQGQLLGIGACLGAVACYGIAFPYSRRHLTGLADPPVALATGQVVFGAIQLLPFALVAGHIHHHIPGSSILALAALGVVGSGIAYILNFHVVKHAPATIASSVTYLIPLFAVIVGAAFLGESVTWYEPVGGVLILAGAAISQDRLHRRRKKVRTP
ncbi:MAG: DMT family transporter [Actinomycetota bacterium]|nr:DMT family transporter [Actinomycetota bacterium]